MKAVNPNFILREWQLAPAFQQATSGDYGATLQRLMTKPCAEHAEASCVHALEPQDASGNDGFSHMSCFS